MEILIWIIGGFIGIMIVCTLICLIFALIVYSIPIVMGIGAGLLLFQVIGGWSILVGFIVFSLLAEKIWSRNRFGFENNNDYYSNEADLTSDSEITSILPQTQHRISHETNSSLPIIYGRGRVRGRVETDEQIESRKVWNDTMQHRIQKRTNFDIEIYPTKTN